MNLFAAYNVSIFFTLRVLIDGILIAIEPVQCVGDSCSD